MHLFTAIYLVFALATPESQPPQKKCKCENCQCSPDMHCGCLYKSDKEEKNNSELKKEVPREE